MRLRIDPDRCTGHGRCYSLAPELFDCDDEGNGFVRVDAELDDAELTEDQLPRAELAVNSCPERAITLG